MTQTQVNGEKRVVTLEDIEAHQRYLLADGTEVPGSTTVINNLDKSAPLMYWAWDCGKKGLDYRKVKDKAANIGKIAHFLCECHLNNWEPDLRNYSKDDISRATVSYGKFLEYKYREDFEHVKSEFQLVSETYKYGGTLDWVARDRNGDLVLIDLKTSKGIYDPYLYQVASYENLWNEHISQKIKRRIIVRIGKEKSGDFETRELYGDISDYFNVFKDLVSLYYSLKKVKYR